MSKLKLIDLENECADKTLQEVATLVNKNAICRIELIEADYSELTQKELYKLAIDKNYTNLANSLIYDDKKRIKELYIVNMFRNNDDANKEIAITTQNCTFLNRIIGDSSLSLSSDIEAVKEAKKSFLVSYKMKLDKKATTGKLTKSFFTENINNGNYEIVIIKMCVKLEAILKADHHLEGDFFEIMDKFCRALNHDDGWGYVIEDEIVPLLNKLRKERNNIVHPMDKNVSGESDTTLTVDELKRIVDYVFKLEKE